MNEYGVEPEQQLLEGEDGYAVNRGTEEDELKEEERDEVLSQ